MVRGAACIGIGGSKFRQPQSLPGWLQAGRAACRLAPLWPGQEDREGVELKTEVRAFLEGRLPEIARLNVNP